MEELEERALDAEKRELPAPGKRSRADDKASPAKRSRTAPTPAELAAETLRVLETRGAGKTC